MHQEFTLLLTDEQGQTQSVAVTSTRFTIGRGQDNDLAINDAGLSRQHALIESCGGRFQISDCGSQNGTFVNDNPIAGATVLNDGDVISIGNACDITVSMAEASPTATKQAVSPSAGMNWLSPVVIAAAAIVVILFGAGLLFIFFRSDGRTDNTRAPLQGSSMTTSGIISGKSSSLPTIVAGSKNASESGASTGGVCGAVSSEQIEKAAVQVIGRISSDNQLYDFPPKALSDIKQKIEQYCKSNELSAALRSITQRKAELAAQVRSSGQGIEPYLLAYAALAETDGGRTSSDPIATTRQMLPILVYLRTHFGNDADSSLIVVAAYTMGPGTKKSHPLLPTMRRLVQNNPAAKRNVWYLNERNGLTDEAYNLVLRFLALGIIAQNPRQFGVQADALVF